MKIRSGFVSNSSSSSFVVVAPKKAVDSVLAGLETEYEKAAVRHIMVEKKFLGQEVCVFQGMEGNYDSWEYGFSVGDYIKDEDEKDEALCPSEVFSDFVKKLKKITSDVIETETDC